MNIGEIRDILIQENFSELIYSIKKYPTTPDIKTVILSSKIPNILKDKGIQISLTVISCLYDPKVNKRQDVDCPHRWFTLKENVSACVPKFKSVNTSPNYTPTPEKEVNLPNSTFNIIPYIIPSINPLKDGKKERDNNIPALFQNLNFLKPENNYQGQRFRDQDGYEQAIIKSLIKMNEYDLKLVKYVVDNGLTAAIYNKNNPVPLKQDVEPLNSMRAGLGDRRPRFYEMIKRINLGKDNAVAENLRRIFLPEEQKGGTRRKHKRYRKTKNASHRN